MANADLNAFVQNFAKSLQEGMTSRGSDPLGQARSLISTGRTAPVEVIAPDYSQSPGLGSRILDLLSRPSYAVNSALDETAKAVHNTDIGRPSWEVPEEEKPNYGAAIVGGLSG